MTIFIYIYLTEIKNFFIFFIMVRQRTNFPKSPKPLKFNYLTPKQGTYGVTSVNPSKEKSTSPNLDSNGFTPISSPVKLKKNGCNVKCYKKFVPKGPGKLQSKFSPKLTLDIFHDVPNRLPTLQKPFVRNSTLKHPHMIFQSSFLNARPYRPLVSTQGGTAKIFRE